MIFILQDNKEKMSTTVIVDQHKHTIKWSGGKLSFDDKELEIKSWCNHELYVKENMDRYEGLPEAQKFNHEENGSDAEAFYNSLANDNLYKIRINLTSHYDGENFPTICGDAFKMELMDAIVSRLIQGQSVADFYEICDNVLFYNGHAVRLLCTSLFRLQSSSITVIVSAGVTVK
jgi:hypothetical protein